MPLRDERTTGKRERERERETRFGGGRGTTETIISLRVHFEIVLWHEFECSEGFSRRQKGLWDVGGREGKEREIENEGDLGN